MNAPSARGRTWLTLYSRGAPSRMAFRVGGSIFNPASVFPQVLSNASPFCQHKVLLRRQTAQTRRAGESGAHARHTPTSGVADRAQQAAGVLLKRLARINHSAQAALLAVAHASYIVKQQPREGVIEQRIYCKVTRRSVLLHCVRPQPGAVVPYCRGRNTSILWLQTTVTYAPWLVAHQSRTILAKPCNNVAFSAH